MNINVYREYAKSILENMLDNTLIDIKSSLYLEIISPKTQKKLRSYIRFQEMAKWAKNHLTLLSL